MAAVVPNLPRAIDGILDPTEVFASLVIRLISRTELSVFDAFS